MEKVEHQLIFSQEDKICRSLFFIHRVFPFFRTEIFQNVFSIPFIEMYSGIHCGILSGIHSGINSGIHSGIHSEISTFRIRNVFLATYIHTTQNLHHSSGKSKYSGTFYSGIHSVQYLNVRYVRENGNSILSSSYRAVLKSLLIYGDQRPNEAAAPLTIQNKKVCWLSQAKSIKMLSHALLLSISPHSRCSLSSHTFIDSA